MERNFHIEYEEQQRRAMIEAIEKGVLILTAKTKVRLLPPLNIPMAELKEAVEILKSALKP